MRGHVIRVAAHQLPGDRDRPLALGARTVRVALPEDDLDPPLMPDEIAMPQPERLPDPHPRKRQEREQEPIAQPLLRMNDRRNLRHRQRPRQPPTLAHPPDPAARHGLRDPMQERPVAPPARARVINQRRRELKAIALVVLVKPGHGAQGPIHRPPPPAGIAAREHDHVLRRRAQPSGELPQRLYRRPVPGQPPGRQERPVQLQIVRIRAHCVRRPLDVRQPRQVALHRLNRQTIGTDQRPRLHPGDRHRDPTHHKPAPRRLRATIGTGCSRGGQARRSGSVTATRWSH